MEFEIDSPIRKRPPRRRARNRLRAAIATAVAAAALLALGAGTAGAQSISDLNSKIACAQSQAQSLSADVEAKAAQVAAAQQQAAAAAQREAQLSSLLAEGQQRAAELAVKVEQTQSHLQRARAHLQRALGALSGAPRRDLQGRRPERDRAPAQRPRLRRPGQPRRACSAGSRTPTPTLAKRVRSLRNQVKDALSSVRQAKAAAGRLQRPRRRDARDQIASVRANAEAAGRAARCGPPAGAGRDRDASVQGLELGEPGPADSGRPGRRRPAGPGGSAGVGRLSAADGLELGRQLGDPAGDRDVRVGRKLQRGQPLVGRRRRVPDPPVHLAALRRQRRPAGRLALRAEPTSPPRSGPIPARAPGSARSRASAFRHTPTSPSNHLAHGAASLGANSRTRALRGPARLDGLL